MDIARKKSLTARVSPDRCRSTDAATMRSAACALLPTNGAAPPPGEDEGSEGEGSEGEGDGSEGEEDEVCSPPH